MSESVVDRLKKLLNLAERGATEGERANAAARAIELMARHNLSMFDLQSDADVPPIEEGRIDDEEGAPTGRVENWEKGLFGVMCEMFGAKGWMKTVGNKHHEFRIVGPRDSVSTARYLYMWLRRQIAEMSRAATRDRGESNAWRRSFALGVVARVHARMSEVRRTVYAEASTTAMVLVDRQKEAIDARMSEMTLRPVKAGVRKRPDAGGHGWHAGADVDLGDAESAKLGQGNKKLSGGSR